MRSILLFPSLSTLNFSSFSSILEKFSADRISSGSINSVKSSRTKLINAAIVTSSRVPIPSILTNSSSFWRSSIFSICLKNCSRVRGVVRLKVTASGCVKTKLIPRLSSPAESAQMAQSLASNLSVA